MKFKKQKKNDDNIRMLKSTDCISSKLNQLHLNGIDFKNSSSTFQKVQLVTLAT